MGNKQEMAAMKELSPTLLDEIKHALAITWSDEDKEIARIAGRSVYAIHDLVGAELDLDVNLSAREMVIERSRYDYNNALDEFELNFKHQLSRLILHVAIDERKKTENGD
ncbi:hypothetical protein ACQKFK_15155 [Bacillus mycoides]|uniref:hypothetical protein n=1 Tax=Bacillus mycoides TaxID=1405 RepID=UPI003CFF03FC